MQRRAFLNLVASLAATTPIAANAFTGALGSAKLKVVLVGTGVRGTSFWGKRLVDTYPEQIEFVGLCDPNPGRLAYAKKYIGVDCPTYAATDFERMLSEQRPDLVMVTTTDATHHEYIIKGLNSNIDVLTEKPLTTDERKCQAILDAERASEKNLIVGFNYRWSPYNTKVKELIRDGAIGKVTSVDFHWYLNTYHGASYFRRWHGLRQVGGTLWVHKATHHFDLLNWWLDSEPAEVFAYGDLTHYGSANDFRGPYCRTCELKDKCDYYWDITESQRNMDLYVKNEQYDGYIRDNCLFREDINIYDRMSAQIKYADSTIVNYSLTTYSPFEGWRIAFNGTEGRIEAALDIPYHSKEQLSQDELHALEMSQGGTVERVEPVIVHKLWQKHEKVQVPYSRGGHGGGDALLHDQIFKYPEREDPYARAAGVRDGAMSILIGVAARKSIESGEPVKIAELTDLQPRPVRL